MTVHCSLSARILQVSGWQRQASACRWLLGTRQCHRRAAQAPLAAATRFGNAQGGFTLAEVLLASTLTVMITAVAVTALKTTTDASQMIEKTTQATSGVRFAARMLAQDLANFYRDADAQNMLLIGNAQGSDAGETPSLKFYTVGRLKARPDQPEGDVYEVEYLLGESKATEGQLDEDAESMQKTLYRRWWPNPDKKRQPGGMLSILARNVNVFQLRFYDGKQWVNQWTEDMKELPQVLEVTLAVVPQEGQRGEPIIETFTVSFPRMPQATQESGGGPGGSGSSEQGGGAPRSGAPGSEQPSGQPGSNEGR